MATVTGTSGIALGNIPLSTVMVDREATVEIVSGSASGVIDEVSGLISAAISTVWKAGGSKTSGQLLPSLLVSGNEGYVYNLSGTDNVTTDTYWVEGAGKTVLVGTDVAVVAVQSGSETSYKFNALAPRDASAVLSITGNSSDDTVTPTSGDIAIYGCGAVNVGKVGGSSLVISVAEASTESGAYTAGVVSIATGLDDNTANVVPTAAQVSGGLAAKVTGSTLHTNLVTSGMSHKTSGVSGNTIYALIEALHASDNTSES